ncbi:FG-GAP-like repeat-containing protein [Embleya sp. NPDC008237]|uniref:FG-GAP-like repeat-containing protein n=1 Tax=Embleya sp. NPDC008237 TaxID=3363978 RepID=UPI0036E9B86F
MGHPPPRSQRIRPSLSAAVCGLVGLTLTCGVLAPVAQAAPATPGAAAVKPVAASADPQDPTPAAKAEAEQSASAKARATKQPVPVPALTTETDTVTALPDGTMSLKRTIVPTRTKKTGTWVDLDATLRPSADGRVRPVSTTDDLVLGGGGNDVLASITSNGRTLALTWPGTLPKPVLEGSSALYPSVLPDVDLKVTAAKQGGFAHTLIVKTPQAAKNPKLATLRLGTSTTGVTLAENSDGSLVAKTADGAPVFVAPTPQMWDSRTTPTDPAAARSAIAQSASAGNVPQGEPTSDAHRPGAHARTADLDTTVDAKSLTLAADASLLAAPDTVFPVYIDPTWGRWAETWGWAQSAYPTTPGRDNTKYQPGVGYQQWPPDKKGLERSFFRVPIGLAGTDIIGATFSVKQVDSAMHSCTDSPQPVYLNQVTGTLDNYTNWNNQPAGNRTAWASGSFPGSSADDHCAPRMLDFTVTDQIAARLGTPSVILAVQGNESQVSGNNGFKRVSREPADTVLSVNYNTAPNPPTNLRTDPAPINGAASGNCGYIGLLNQDVGRLRMFADRNDPDGDDGDLWFALDEMTDTGKTEIWNSGWTSWGPNGATGSADVPAALLKAGKRYQTSVKGGDGRRPSGWTDGCVFTVDGTVPTVGEVTSIDFPKNGGNKTTDNTGTFYVDAADVDSGVGRVEFALNSTLPVGEAPTATWDEKVGKWRITDLYVSRWGTNTLTVRAVDQAGNRSQSFVYEFYAPGNPNARTELGDINGDTRIDMLAVNDAGDLRMYDAATDPTTGGRTTSLAAQGPKRTATNAPTWTGALVAHRGGAGVTKDDLFVHDGSSLYVYRNSDGYTALPKPGSANNGGQFYVAENRVLATRPPRCLIAATNLACPAGTLAANWTKVKQIVAPGDVDGDGRLDLITVEGDTNQLFLFTGNGTPGQFNPYAKLLSTANWADRDIIAPGDVTADARPDLWVRDRTTGKLYQYPSHKISPTLTDVAALGDDSRRVQLAADMTTAVYPGLHADGDLDGDKIADLWAEGPGGSLYLIRGNPAGSATAFGTAQLLANSQTPWTTCKPFATAFDASKTFDICGPILAKYEALGGPGGPMRLPTTPVREDGQGGRFVDFQGTSNDATFGCINWSPYTGAWFQHGGTRQKWLDSGGLTGPLGYPVSDEITVRDGADQVVGWISRYGGTPAGGAGAVTWDGRTGAHVITGPIYDRWQSMGGPLSRLGFPEMDVSPTTLKPGKYVNFRIPTATASTGSIYWSAATGAWPVYGANLTVWAAQRWEGGWLGFPTSDEYPVTGGVRGDYEGGYIRWNEFAGGSAAHLANDKTAAQRSEFAGDFDGDHRADVLTVYDFGSETTGFYVASGNADGTVGAPRRAWTSHYGWFDSTRAKFAIGDFDGNGRADIGALYGYPNGSTRLFTFLSRADGTFEEGVPSAYTPPGNWEWAKAQFLAGDFNGDGRADTAMIYDHGNEAAAAYTWISKVDGSGTFTDAFASWQSGPGNWVQPRGKYVAGDFDGDGRADIGAMYGYGDLNGGAVALFTLKSRPDGGFDDPVKSWNVPVGNWEWNRVILSAGDYNGDHRADIAATYDYGGDTTGIFTFAGNTDGSFTTDVRAWKSATGTWDSKWAMPTSGDFNGDGHADIGAMYDWSDGSSTFNTFLGKADGTLENPFQAWRAAPGTW